jgi:glyoxylase-like metal-dependent hydrolase (beta-lactamase superfamily II)
MDHPLLSEETTRISDHVWAIMGFPNVAIVVGDHATLVVDTGLGAKNGATVARVATKLAPNNKKLFLTTTHFHPEHAGGEPGFPAGTNSDPGCGAAARDGEARTGNDRYVQLDVCAK